MFVDEIFRSCKTNEYCNFTKFEHQRTSLKYFSNDSISQKKGHVSTPLAVLLKTWCVLSFLGAKFAVLGCYNQYPCESGYPEPV